MVANRTRGARGGLKLNCTLGESPTHWRLRPQPQRKKFLAFRICARLIFSEKGKGVFLGVLPSKYSGSAWGFNTDSVLPKLFSGGKDLAKPRLILFLHFVRAEEGSGEESARASFLFFNRERCRPKISFISPLR